MKLSVDIKNAQGGYPYKYKRIPMNRLKRWEREAAQLEAENDALRESAYKVLSWMDESGPGADELLALLTGGER